MLKKYLIACLTIMSVIASCAFGTQNFPPENTLLKIVHCRYMPLYFEGINGKPRGILVDFWKKWSQKVNVPVDFILMDWDDALDSIKSGEADINAMMYQSAEREQYFDFSNPILDLSIYIFYSIGIDPPVTAEALSGRKVGVVKADYSIEYLKTHHPKALIKEYPEHESVITAMLKGEIDIFVMEAPVASTYIAKHDALHKIAKVEKPLYTKPVHAGVKKGNHALIELINRGFAGFTKEDFSVIVKNWTGNTNPAGWHPNADKVHIVTSLDNMPFHFADNNGKPAGMFVDMWRLWSKKSGIDVEFSSAPWSESLSMVKNGIADIHAGCFFSTQRDTYLDYSNSLLANCETHFFFHESIFGLKNLEDLLSFKIGVLKQDYAVEFIRRELPGAALVEYNSHRELFAGVEKGQIRVFICDTPVALYLLAEKNLLHRFRYHIAHPLYKSSFYAAVKEGNSKLIARINRGLKEITPEERAAIERRWMGRSDYNNEAQLVVAVTQGFPPFSMLNANGRPSGMLIDMWSSWAEKTGVKVEFRMFNGIDAVNALKDGIVDILSTLPPDDSVKGWSTFSDSYYLFRWHLYLADDNLKMDDFENLGNIETANTQKEIEIATDLKINRKTDNIKASDTEQIVTIGMVVGTQTFEYVNSLELHLKNPNSQTIRFLPKSFETTREMVLAAEAGEVQTFLGIPQEISSHLAQLGMSGQFRMTREPLTEQKGMAAVRNYNPELIERINIGLNSLSEGKEYDKIQKKWLGNRFENGFDPVYIRNLLLKMAFGGILLILLVLFWNRQIRQREKAMRKAREIAESASRAKSEFLASLSHEVRTPLNAILGMTEITLRTELDQDQIKNLNVVKTSARHLLGVINDILELSTIEAGKMKIQNVLFDMDELLEGIIHTYSYSDQARAKGLKISLLKPEESTLKKLGFYRSDPVRLRQILGNLMDNAVKFTPAGSVRMVVDHAQDDRVNGLSLNKELLRFIIKDTGIGIPYEKQDVIFESFTQAEGSTTRKYGGTGLGLAICKETAHMMGGILKLESEPDKGSTFTLVLPIEKADESDLPASNLSDNRDSNSMPLKILLVEDCQVNAEVAKEYLNQLGHHAIVALDGNQAIKILEHNTIDMVLMDIEMPVLDGLAVTRRIRNGVAGAHNMDIPVIAMTAHVLEEYREKSREAEMNDFLPKPVEISELESVIARNRVLVKPALSGKEFMGTSFCQNNLSSSGFSSQAFPSKQRLRSPPITTPSGLTGSQATNDSESIITPLLDEEEGLKLFARNSTLLNKIYAIFIAETPALTEKFATALKDRDIDSVRFASHTLKGACARICAMSSKKLFQEIEYAAKDGRWSEIDALSDKALSEAYKVIEMLKKRF